MSPQQQIWEKHKRTMPGKRIWAFMVEGRLFVGDTLEAARYKYQVAKPSKKWLIWVIDTYPEYIPNK